MPLPFSIEARGLELRGAYGRETCVQDWHDGKDFKITGGPYCSKRDVDEMRKEGFQMLEFVDSKGELIERIMLDESLPDWGWKRLPS